MYGCMYVYCNILIKLTSFFISRAMRYRKEILNQLFYQGLRTTSNQIIELMFLQKFKNMKSREFKQLCMFKGSIVIILTYPPYV